MKHLVTLVAIMLLSSGAAVASGSSKPQPTPQLTPQQSEVQSQGQGQEQTTKVNSDAESYSESTAVSTGGDVSVSDNSTSSSTTTYTEKRRPVNTAYAAPLVAGDDTCMGSTSAGGMGITFGFSFATTWKDTDCVIRKDARFLQNAQRQDIALSLMCEKPSVIAAVKRAGTDAEKRACGLEVAPITPTVTRPPAPSYTGERG
jgi:hypothetical protein